MESLETKLGQSFAGMLLICLSGFTVSAHTLWMHNKAQEMGGGSYCSAGTVCDCASVIGNAEWNTVPVLGVPWGLMGMLVFALFMWDSHHNGKRANSRMGSNQHKNWDQFRNSWLVCNSCI